MARHPPQAHLRVLQPHEPRDDERPCPVPRGLLPALLLRRARPHLVGELRPGPLEDVRRLRVVPELRPPRGPGEHPRRGVRRTHPDKHRRVRDGRRRVDRDERGPALAPRRAQAGGGGYGLREAPGVRHARLRRGRRGRVRSAARRRRHERRHRPDRDERRPRQHRERPPEHGHRLHPRREAARERAGEGHERVHPGGIHGRPHGERGQLRSHRDGPRGPSGVPHAGRLRRDVRAGARGGGEEERLRLGRDTRDEG
mmetsp:Transcript_36223/g.81431  ORF Transcript_36223/g.81431 Transcript_36223/m.81431 type:complete len:256 (+) Transcript_36223:1947-2714(+)